MRLISLKKYWGLSVNDVWFLGGKWKLRNFSKIVTDKRTPKTFKIKIKNWKDWRFLPFLAKIYILRLIVIVRRPAVPSIVDLNEKWICNEFEKGSRTLKKFLKNYFTRLSIVEKFRTCFLFIISYNFFFIRSLICHLANFWI